MPSRAGRCSAKLVNGSRDERPASYSPRAFGLGYAVSRSAGSHSTDADRRQELAMRVRLAGLRSRSLNLDGRRTARGMTS
jgi:hypothetical protein